MIQILVIDDYPMMANLIAEALLKDGHQVVTVGSAEEGLAQLPFNTFQVAFIDHHLPGMEGLVLGGYLRRNNPHMQLALVTGEPDPKLKRQSDQLMITFIQKPFDLRRLKEVVDLYLAEAKERREQRAGRQEPDFEAALALYHRDLPEYFSLPRAPERLVEALRRRLKECLNNLSCGSRYNERDRVAALAGLLALQVLGIPAPKDKDGRTLFEAYDQAMRENGRHAEFGADPKEASE
jgi:CheY-like chemotaxis protein